MMSNPVVDFKAETELAFDKAFKSAKGGDDQWNSFLAEYGINPLTGSNKDSLAKMDLPMTTGAYPIELRWALEAIVAKHKIIAENHQPLLDLLNGFSIEAELIRYQQKIKPFGGFNNIFKNAVNSTKNYSAGIGEAKKSAVRCNSCGAPRLEEMQYDNCLFCGSELFVKNNS